MLITQVNGYPSENDKDRYDIEFKVGGNIYAVLKADPEKIPSVGHTVTLTEQANGAVIYLVVETGQGYKPVFISGLTDLILLEAL